MNLGSTRAGPVLCFGELLLRLACSSGRRLSEAAEFGVHVGGAEANVAAALAQLGHETEIVTFVPEGPLGDLTVGRFRSLGVGTNLVARASGRLGLYFFEPGAGVRPSRIVYDRGNSVFAAHAGEMDWPALLERAGWLHLSGITLALGEGAAQSALAAASAARDIGVPVSFDANYRASLWQGRAEEAAELFSQMMGHTDLLFASEQDVERATGEPSALAAFSTLSCVASTVREIGADGAQKLSARVESRDGVEEAGPILLPSVTDRIGGGDAFAAGIIHGLLLSLPLSEVVQRGLAAFCLKHSIAGDQWIGSAQELEQFDRLRASDVQR